MALEQVVRTLKPESGRAYVVVYTGDGDFMPSARLASALPVIDLQTGTAPLADHLHVTPPDHDALLVDHHFQLSSEIDPHARLDRLFRSVADTLGRDATCVVLGGRGADGALGLKRTKELGGLTIAQVPAESEFPAMPLAAIGTGLVDLVLPAADIAARIAAFDPASEDIAEDDRRAQDPVADTLRDILVLVRVRTGHDFSQYKRPTLYRRIARRMQVCECETLSDYHAFLRAHPGELSRLLRDFLISVTNFFRDPDAFETLATTIIPRLFADKGPADQIRVWVAGCATGEEAYSLGMLLLEAASQRVESPRIQIFATDIDEDSLFDARAGRYPSSISVDVSPARLSRFFVRDGHGYRVVKELREIILFSPHNVLRDPPFSRLDLVTCRNVLIYLNREAQERVFAIFHFALRADGFLFLGSSESAEAAPMQFGWVEGARVFSRRLAPASLVITSMEPNTRWNPRSASLPPSGDRRFTSFGEMHHRLVEHYAPPSVIVNEDLDVVHMSDHARDFLTVGAGEPSRQLLDLVHPALRLDLRASLYTARQRGPAPDARVIRFDDNGRQRAVEIRVRAVELPTIGDGMSLVMFDERDPAAMPAVERVSDSTIEPLVRELEGELMHTRDQLRSTIEQYETTVEELKASNEELFAINEELRAATEELETSKEELQSVNEELTTVNHELKAKVDEISRANNDLQNLMTSTDIAVLFLDRDLNIKRFTRRAHDLFNIIPSDVGRPFVHLTHNLVDSDLARTAIEVLGHLHVTEREVATHSGERYLARFLPYRSLDARIEGVVMTFVDVSELAAVEEALRARDVELRESEARLRLTLSIVPVVATSQDVELRYTWAYARGHDLGPSVSLDRYMSVTEASRLGALKALALRDGVGQRTELELGFERGESQIFDVRIEPVRLNDQIIGVTTVGFDITTAKRAEVVLRESDRRKDEFLATLSHELRNPLTPLRVALDLQKLAANDPVQVERTRTIMDRQVDQLISLVDELLDMSRITQGKVELVPRPIDLADIVRAAVEDTRPLIESARHKLELELGSEPLRVTGEAPRLVQVLVNLLTNAAKYTPDGGTIVIEASHDKARGRQVIRVRDTGIGLAPEQLRDVFELFVQSRDARGRARGGLGIGLNLVRRLVEMHGGEVFAFSDGPGHGSTFVVEIPAHH